MGFKNYSESEIKKEAVSIGKKIYSFKELGSEEYRSSSLLVNSLKRHGFKVKYPYKTMETAFMAEYGNGHPSIGFLAEYDALPNGHSCGHNLISTWAFASAVLLKSKIKNGKVIVFGTPSEEGIGKYGGGKARLAEKGAFKEADIMFGMHPDDKWNVGDTDLADITLSFVFTGEATNIAERRKRHLNALRSAVDLYNRIQKLDDGNKKREVILGMIIKEGGIASNIIPHKAVLEADIRALKVKKLEELIKYVKNVARMVSHKHGTRLRIEENTPVYTEYNPNIFLDSLLENALLKRGIKPMNTDRSNEFPTGSTDEANVSKLVPTGHIDAAICDHAVETHSGEFNILAGRELAYKRTMIAVDSTVEAAFSIFSNQKFLPLAKAEFVKSTR